MDCKEKQAAIRVSRRLLIGNHVAVVVAVVVRIVEVVRIGQVVGLMKALLVVRVGLIAVMV